MKSPAHSLGHCNSSTVSFSAALINRCISLSSAASVHAHLVKLGFHHHTFIGNRLIGLYSLLGAASFSLLAFQDIPTKNTFTWNTLLSTFCKAGHLDAARNLFDEMPERDTVSWNSMISGYASAGLIEEAFSVLHRMQEVGVRPSGFTCSISASCISSAWAAKEVHASIIRSGLNLWNPVVGNSLINMYGRVGLIDCACNVFQTMEDPDIISWNSVISACADSGCGDKSLQWFCLMRASGLSSDQFTVSSVINVCGDLEDLAKGEQLLAHCFKVGYISNSIVCSAVIDMYSKCGRMDDSVRFFQEMAKWDSALCNAMISGYARNGFMDEAVRFFADALRKGIRPTEFTFASVLRSSSCFGLNEQGTQIHCCVLKLGLEADMIIASALVDMYAKLGLADLAMRIFLAIRARDLVCWNALITGLAQNGQGIEALRIFRQMQETGIQPDRITLHGVLSACSHEGLILKGREIFLSMKKKYGLRHSLEHYACMVDMLGRAGMLEEAMEFIDSMPHKRSAPIWLSLLEACRIHGNLRILEIVAEKVMETEPRSSLPYLVLTRIYGMRGRWESMARVLRSMKERGVKKVGGCSWICIQNHIFVFRSDQILHCGGENMYSALRLLIWELEREGYVPEEQAIFEDG